MNKAERLIARLVDEQKLAGEDAVTLIKAIHQIDQIDQNKSSTMDDLLEIIQPRKNKALDSHYQYPYPQNPITGISDGNTTVTY